MNIIDVNSDLINFDMGKFQNSYIHLMDGGLGNQLLQVLSISSLIQKNENSIILDFLDKSEYYLKYNLQGIPAISQVNLPSNFYILYNSNQSEIIDNAALRYKLYGRERILIHIDKINIDSNINLNQYIGMGWKSENEIEINQFRENILKSNIQKFVQNRDSSIGIHLREGDYSKHPELGKLNTKYYLKALSKIKEAPSKVFIYSDSLEAADKLQKSLESKNKKLRIQISSENDPSRIIFAIASHEILILANSTLSWWAGRLSNSKMIFYPHPWYISKSIILPLPNYWIKLKRTMFNYLLNYTLSSIKYRRIRN